MELDFSSVYPTTLNWVVVGLMATTFIAFFKWLFAQHGVPGLSALFAAV